MAAKLQEKLILKWVGFLGLGTSFETPFLDFLRSRKGVPF